MHLSIAEKKSKVRQEQQREKEENEMVAQHALLQRQREDEMR